MNLSCSLSVAAALTLIICFPVDAERMTNQPVQPSSNPAAVKCIKDGYQLDPIIKNGVQVGNMCVDPITGKQCEVWEYYHGLCSLSGKSVPKKNPNKMQ